MGRWIQGSNVGDRGDTGLLKRASPSDGRRPSDLPPISLCTPKNSENPFQNTLTAMHRKLTRNFHAKRTYMVAMLVTGLRTAAALKRSPYCPTRWSERKPPCEPPQAATRAGSRCGLVLSTCALGNQCTSLAMPCEEEDRCMSHSVSQSVHTPCSHPCDLANQSTARGTWQPPRGSTPPLTPQRFTLFSHTVGGGAGGRSLSGGGTDRRGTSACSAPAQRPAPYRPRLASPPCHIDCRPGPARNRCCRGSCTASHCSPAAPAARTPQSAPVYPGMQWMQASKRYAQRCKCKQVQPSSPARFKEAAAPRNRTYSSILNPTPSYSQELCNLS